MPHLITLPDGTTAWVADGVSPAKGMELAKTAYPDAFPPPPTALGQALNAPKNILKGAGSGIVSAIGGLGALPYTGLRYFNPEMTPFAETGFGKSITSAEQSLAPTDEGYGSQLSHGLGSFLSVFGPQAIARGVGTAGRFATGIAPKAATPIAVAQTAGLGAEEARNRVEAARADGLTVTPGQEFGSLVAGVPGGLTELLPIQNLFRATKGLNTGLTKGFQTAGFEGVKNFGKRALQQAGIEAAQEAGSGVIQDVIAQQIYNPNQEIGGSALKEGALGGGVGAIAQLGLDLALRKDIKMAYQISQKKKSDEDLAKQMEEVKAETAKKRAETDAALGISPLLALPAPKEQITPSQAKHPIYNPLGNFSEGDLDPANILAINAKRAEENKPKLKSFSIEDLADSGMSQADISGLIAKKTGYAGTEADAANIPQHINDVLSLAAEKNVDPNSQGFKDFLRRATGLDDLQGMSAPQLFSAYTAVYRLPDSATPQDLHPGTSATRFSEGQYDTTIKNLNAAHPEDNALTLDDTISQIKEHSGLKNDTDAESLMHTAIRRGDLFAKAYPAPDGTTSISVHVPNANKEAGPDIRKSSVESGIQPESYVIKSSAGAIEEHPTQDAADARVAALTIARQAQADRSLKEVAALSKETDKAQTNLDAMAARGESNTLAFQQKASEVAAKTQANQAKAETLNNTAASLVEPLVVEPKGQQITTKDVHTVYEGNQPIAAFDTAEKAQAHALSRLSEEGLQKYTGKLGEMAQNELTQRQRKEPGISIIQTGGKEKAEEVLLSAGIFTGRFKQKAEELDRKLRPLMSRLGLGDLRLNIAHAIESGGSDGKYAQKIISIALDAKNPIRVLRHEGMHALKELGFFTKEQWRILENKAKSEWVKKYNIPERYADMNVDEQLEEAIADAFSDFDQTKPPAGLMGVLFNKLKTFMEALSNAIEGLGFDTHSSIFGRVSPGGEMAPIKPVITERVSVGRKREPVADAPEAPVEVVAPLPVAKPAIKTIETKGTAVRAREGKPEKVGSGAYKLVKDATGYKFKLLADTFEGEFSTEGKQPAQISSTKQISVSKPEPVAKEKESKPVVKVEKPTVNKSRRETPKGEIHDELNKTPEGRKVIDLFVKQEVAEDKANNSGSVFRYFEGAATRAFAAYAKALRAYAGDTYVGDKSNFNRIDRGLTKEFELHKEVKAEPVVKVEKPTVNKSAKMKKLAKARKIILSADTMNEAIIKMGGINVSLRPDLTGDKKGNQKLPFVGSLFSKNGTTDLSDLALNLGQYGYFTPEETEGVDGGARLLADRLRGEFDGGSPHQSMENMDDAADAALYKRQEEEKELFEAAQAAAKKKGEEFYGAVSPDVLDVLGIPVTPEVLVNGELLARAIAISPEKVDDIATQYEGFVEGFNAAIAKFIKEQRNGGIQTDDGGEIFGDSEAGGTQVQGKKAKFSRRQTETPAFKQWFGKSKAVNADGTPKVWYHGTARDIGTFKPKQAGAIFLTDDPDFAESFADSSAEWMSKHSDQLLSPENEAELRAMLAKIKKNNPNDYSDKIDQAAKEFVLDKLNSGENIMPLYVRAENTLDYENPAHIEILKPTISKRYLVADKDDQEFFQSIILRELKKGDWETIETPDIQKAIKAAGFDSFYIKEGGRKNLAVYSPNQVKSAVGNTGAFSRSNDDVRYSRKVDRTKATGSSKAWILFSEANKGINFTNIKTLAEAGEAAEEHYKDQIKNIPEFDGKAYMEGLTIDDINAYPPDIQHAIQEYKTGNKSKGIQEILDTVASQRKANIKEWKQYIENINPAMGKDPFWRDYAITSLLKSMRTDKPDTGLPLNANALGQLYEKFKQGENINFGKGYQSALVDATKDLVELGDETTGWRKIPQTDRNDPKFDERVAAVQSLSCTGWCTRSTMAAPYIQKGDFWVYVDDKKPQVAIRFEGDQVQEIQGPQNDRSIPTKYIKEITNLVDSGKIKNMTRQTKGDIANAVRKSQFEAMIKEKVASGELVEKDKASAKKNGVNIDKEAKIYVAADGSIIVDGDLSIEEGASIPDLTTVGGYARISEGASAPALTAVGGFADIYPEANVPSLTTVGGDANILRGASAPALTTVGGDAYILGGANVPNLTTVGGDANIRQGASVPNLTTVGGDARIYGSAPALTTVGDAVYIEEGASAPNLTTVGGYAHIKGSAPALTTVEGGVYIGMNSSAPALTTVGGDANIYTEASAPALTTVGGNAYISGGASAPALTTVGGNADIREFASVPNLTTVGGHATIYSSAPKLIRTDIGKEAALKGTPLEKDQGKFSRRENSKGQPIHPTEAGTENFFKWFGNSKATDKEGRPLLLYTGTSKDTDFSIFKVPRNGAWFTTSASDASGYAVTNDNDTHKWVNGKVEAINRASRVIPVYLKITNPYITDGKDFNAKITKAAGDNYKRGQGIEFDKLRQAGYDGVVLSGDTWIALNSPSQIKSAIGNTGEYSDLKGNIKFSRRAGYAPSAMQRAAQPMPALDEANSDLSPDMTAAINRTTTARKNEGWSERIAAAFSPRSFTAFRQAFIHGADSISNLTRESALRFGEQEYHADRSAIAAVLFADRAAGIAASSFVNGPPVYKNGFASVPENSTVRGLIPILEPIMKGGAHMFQRFQFYAGTRRGSRLMYETRVGKDGKTITSTREQNFTKEDIERGKILEKMHPEFKQVFEEYQQYNNGLVQFMKDTGVISAKEAELWTKNWDYIPFYRQMDGDRINAPAIFSSISGVKKPKELKGGEAPLADFMETVIRNSRAAIEAGMKNVAGQRTIRDLQRLNQASEVPPATKGYDIVSIKQAGVTKFYKVDDSLVYEALKGLDAPHLPFVEILAKPANFLRDMVTKDPGFMLANLARDSMQAWVTSGVNMTPLFDTFKQAGKAMLGSNPEAAALARSGYFTGYDFAGDTKSSAAAVEKELRKRTGTQTAGEKALMPLSKIMDVLDKGAHISDLATRAEVYKRVLAETGSEAEATYQALEIMNFSRKGNSALIRIVTALVPFMNARIQGMDVLYRTGFGRSATVHNQKQKKLFATRSLTILGLTAMYLALASDTEEYKNATPEERDNYWILGGLGRIPIPFELGVLFKVFPERIYQHVWGMDTGADLRQSIARNLTSTLVMNPIPHVAMPIVENIANYSAFTGQPIVGKGMEGVYTPYQFNPSTSLLAQLVGKETNQSPLKIDNLIRGYTGTLGTYAVMMLDAVMRGEGDDIKATKTLEQMPVFKRFMTTKQGSGTINAYYELKKEVDTAVKTVNFLERQGDYEELAVFQTGRGGKLLGIKDYMKGLDEEMSSLRAFRSAARRSRMDPDSLATIESNIKDAEINVTKNIQFVKKALD